MRIVLVTCLLVLGATLFGCGDDRPPARVPGPAAGDVAPTAAIEGPVVVFLGDSITAGLHLEGGQDEAFPAVLARRAGAQGLAFRAVNAGVSGDTSAGGLRRLDWVLRSAPDLVILELGTNDALRGQPATEIERNLRAIVDRLRAEKVDLIVLGMLLPPSYGPDYVASFESLYERLGREPGVILVPRFLATVGGRPELNFRDGLHPNARGHELLADALEPALLAWLRDRARPDGGKIPAAVDAEGGIQDRQRRPESDDRSR
ncbi:MAG: arylesterase [Planctomycetes bacterium]|nr:arylesterase [Planctomycetota bacterium]